MFDIINIENNTFDREANRRLAKIRHTETAYDQYDCFYYAVDKKYRQWLNSLCGKKMRNQISQDEFILGCKSIERNVNLHRKENQKKFILARRAELAITMPDASAKYIKKQAYKDMLDILYQQTNRNQRRHTCKLRIIEDSCGL